MLWLDTVDARRQYQNMFETKIRRLLFMMLLLFESLFELRYMWYQLLEITSEYCYCRGITCFIFYTYKIDAIYHKIDLFLVYLSLQRNSFNNYLEKGLKEQRNGKTDEDKVQKDNLTIKVI